MLFGVQAEKSGNGLSSSNKDHKTHGGCSASHTKSIINNVACVTLCSTHLQVMGGEETGVVCSRKSLQVIWSM
jgi:hypothetical protein